MPAMPAMLSGSGAFSPRAMLYLQFYTPQRRICTPYRLGIVV